MFDVESLIQRILADIRERSVAPSGRDERREDGTEKVYRDEPILKTAAQLNRFLPEQYRAMRKLASSPEAYRRPEEWLFWKQGKFMEDFEDDYDYRGEYIRYFPTYQSMNDMQLRGYFSWRTKVRRGVVEETSLSFAFVYIYELINQIGVDSPEEGLDTLRRFWNSYREYEPHLDRYMKRWLADYVVYYGLDRALLEEIAGPSPEDALMVLREGGGRSREELFRALAELSSYAPEKSRFYRENPEDFREAACRVFLRVSEYYAKNRKAGYCEKLFGRVASVPYLMFQSAVFYDSRKYTDYEYRTGSLSRFACKNGQWTRTGILGRLEKSRELGSLLRAVDCALREKSGFGHPLKPEALPKYMQSILDRELDAYLEEKRRSAAPRIELDFSRLQGIRRAADQTRDRLLTEEELREEPPLPPAPAPEPVPAEEPAPGGDAGLTGEERRFLQCLLDGRDYAPEKGVLLSVLADSVNEKLFDRFGDTVIDFSGGEPALIEDYIEELKGIVSR